MLFDLINISDAYTFKAEHLECAAVVTALLGSGQYSAKQMDGDAEVPFFMFGGHDEWFQQHFGHDMYTALRLWTSERKTELIEALNSVLIGDRREYERTLPLLADDKREEWIAGWHDRHRSSLNDIGGRAKRIAMAIAEGHRPESAPQQVFVG